MRVQAIWWLLNAIVGTGLLGCASQRTSSSFQLIHRVDVFKGRGRVEDANQTVFVRNLKRTKQLRVNMVEFRGEIGLHVHPDADHSLIVIEGTIQLEAGDRSATMTVGDFVSIPRGMPHKYIVQGERAVIVSMDAPYYDPEKTIRLFEERSATLP